jgi:glutamate synthase domain-containing protein 3
MTGGTLYMYQAPGSKINSEYIGETVISEPDNDKLYGILRDYAHETGSKKAEYIVSDWENARKQFKKFIPLSMITVGETSEIEPESTKK